MVYLCPPTPTHPQCSTLRPPWHTTRVCDNAFQIQPCRSAQRRCHRSQRLPVLGLCPPATAKPPKIHYCYVLARHCCPVRCLSVPGLCSPATTNPCILTTVMYSSRYRCLLQHLPVPWFCHQQQPNSPEASLVVTCWHAPLAYNTASPLTRHTRAVVGNSPRQ
jgi:hypothetical protein